MESGASERYEESEMPASREEEDTGGGVEYREPEERDQDIRPEREPEPERERRRGAERETLREEPQQKPRHPASPEAIQEAISDVNQIIDTLRDTLDDMDELLELLEIAERQQTASEQEIDSLRRALRNLQRSRGGSESRGR